MLGAAECIKVLTVQGSLQRVQCGQGACDVCSVLRPEHLGVTKPLGVILSSFTVDSDVAMFCTDAEKVCLYLCDQNCEIFYNV